VSKREDSFDGGLYGSSAPDVVVMSNPSILMIGCFSRRIALYITTTDGDETRVAHTGGNSIYKS
jgi:hypothetical protein